MAKKTQAEPAVEVVVKDSSAELVKALVTAIEQTRPVHKKSAAERKPATPWTPADGSPKLKLKRKMYQHSIPIDPDLHTNEEIDLMNKLRPGRFMDGWVKVVRRRDKGIDVDYPVRTAAQRLKLVSTYGIRNFSELLQRCIIEAENPEKYKVAEEYDS